MYIFIYICIYLYIYTHIYIYINSCCIILQREPLRLPVPRRTVSNIRDWSVPYSTQPVSIRGTETTNYDSRFSLLFLPGFTVSINNRNKSYKRHIFLTFWPQYLKTLLRLLLSTFFPVHHLQPSIQSTLLYCRSSMVKQTKRRNITAGCHSVTSLKIPRHACSMITSAKYPAICQRDWADITRFRSVKSCASLSACRV
jgi:hypothetical protein